MGQTKILCNFLLFFFIAEVSGSQLLLRHYEFAAKYSCIEHMNLFLDRAVLMSSMFLDNSTVEKFDCHTTVTSRTGETGIISVIQKMRLMKSHNCNSFISFGNEKERLCGDIVFGMKPTAEQKLPKGPEFISAYGGPFFREAPTYEPYTTSTPNIFPRMYLEGPMNNRKHLLPPGATVNPHGTTEIKTHITSLDMADSKSEDILIAFTGYRDCDGGKVEEGWFNCGYGLCILDQYVNDGIVNCPFGDCRDEQNCENALLLSPPLQGFLNHVKEPEKNDTVSNKLRRSLESLNHISREWDGFTEKYLSTTDGVSDIGGKLEKQNQILERISKVMEDAVAIIDDRI